MPFFSSSQKIKNSPHSGFSLIELMITIAIVTIVTGLVMVRYATFNNVIILKSQAYEMALDIREAQSLGVSVAGRAGDFRSAYGIYIDLTSRNTYKLFQDAHHSGTMYRYDTGEAVGMKHTIDSRFTILQICTTVFGNRTCDASDGAYASIAFKRPDFDAIISTNTVSNPDQIDIIIAVKNNHSIYRTVTVYVSGQISAR